MKIFLDNLAFPSHFSMVKMVAQISIVGVVLHNSAVLLKLHV